jgi:hypothetical protein
MQGLNPNSTREVIDLLLHTAEQQLATSRYRSADRELRKAWVIGWLLRELAQEYQTSYDLRRRIDQQRSQHK